MLSNGILAWLSNDQGMMSLMASNWLYGVLLVAGIVFLETGVVLFPFLPGDSLLFATGSFLGLNQIHPAWAMFLIGAAAVLGDGVNFLVGRSGPGQMLIRKGWVKPHHLARSHAWFERFGAGAVTLARFVPLVRTVTPFLAGLSGMPARRFAIFNVLGALLWCPGLLLAGYWFGKIDWVRQHMSWVSLAIVLLSLLPVLLHFGRRRLSQGG